MQAGFIENPHKPIVKINVSTCIIFDETSLPLLTLLGKIELKWE